MQSRSHRGVCFVLTLIAIVLPAVARAQSESEIAAARQKGMDFLRSKQLTNGSWEYEGHPVGITALCTLSLVENGVPVTDPVVSKGLEFVRNNTDDLKQTYDIALAILLYSRAGLRTDRAALRTLTARLVAGQLTSGGWSYSCPLASSRILRNPNERPKPKTGPGDNSCTQFAVLGLWVASRHNINIYDSMVLVGERFVQTQNADGGWSYRIVDTDGNPEPSKDSMTFAGLFCLTVARATKVREDQTEADSEQPRASEGATLMQDPIFSRGLTRAGQFVKAGTGARYSLWSAERVGVLLGLQKLGDTDWFEKGATTLLRAQQKDGAWPDAKGGLADTSFAILFLRKANLGSDISRMLTGEPPKPFQITTAKDAPRFDGLSEAVDAAESGDVIRVDGNGPFPLPHLNVGDKQLTIEAGYGYLPVFRYEIGMTRLGLRARPGRDPEARFMLKIQGGQLVLEGLKLEMDPPEVGREVPWAGIVVDGGSLKLLNCGISEGNRKGMACIRLQKTGSLHLANTALIGGRAAIEVAAEGKQQVSISNSLLFSKTGIAVVEEAKAKGAGLSLQLNESTVQADDAFGFAKTSAPIDISSTASVYKCDWLGSALVTSSANKQGRSFAGANNVYDVDKWLGAGGRAVSSVSDAAGWNKFWGGKDNGSKEQSVPFAVRRRIGDFSHRFKVEDWSVSEESTSGRVDGGIESLMVGPGAGYSRYRDSILYNDWKKTRLETASAK